MLKAAIVSHTVIDHIQDEQGNTIADSLGGPTCYSGLIAKKFGFDVIPVTKVGNDFSVNNKRLLHENGIEINQSHITENSPTTRFLITIKKDDRDLFLCSKCEPLRSEDFYGVNADCWIISPVLDELSVDLLAHFAKDIKENDDFILLDPQGYFRLTDQYGNILSVTNFEYDLPSFTALKISQNDQRILTSGLEGEQAMRLIHSSKRIKFLISTQNYRIDLLYDEMHYWVNIPYIETLDSTGAGDILSSAFACAYVKEKGPLWAVCFGAGAIRAALETRLAGLNKVPSKSKIEHCASYYYNTVSFKIL